MELTKTRIVDVWKQKAQQNCCAFFVTVWVVLDFWGDRAGACAARGSREVARGFLVKLGVPRGASKVLTAHIFLLFLISMVLSQKNQIHRAVRGFSASFKRKMVRLALYSHHFSHKNPIYASRNSILWKNPLYIPIKAKESRLNRETTLNLRRMRIVWGEAELFDSPAK